MAVSKRVRYEVLRRDSYTCRYCKATDKPLTIDHVVPTVLGGTDDPSNLVAACGDCNGGKTSSSPDAPLVADVAEDAFRWSKAMQKAQAGMLADLDRREADRQQFAEWWDGWKYGGINNNLHSVPRDLGWGQTVDQLVAAGLPMRILEDCIGIAMTRKHVKKEVVFRYMCGVAWSKLTELQTGAGKVASGGQMGSVATECDPFEAGRASFARELLDELSDEERAYHLDTADYREYQSDDDEPQTEEKLACDAATFALNAARCDGDWLAGRVEQTLKNLPGKLGQQCLAEQRSKDWGNPSSDRIFKVSDALWALEDYIRLPEARTIMDGLPEAERLEWLTFTKALYEGAEVNDDRWLAKAADCVQVYKQGQRFTAMCSCSGESIPDCPALGKYNVRVAELDCCKPGGPEGHEGHLVCERHLEQIMDGSYSSRRGMALTAVDFTEVSAKEQAPF